LRAGYRCSPISDGVKRNLPRYQPQKPNTIARSLAIGTPADGPFALRLIRESALGRGHLRSGNHRFHKLLAETEGISWRPLAASPRRHAKLIAQGRIRPDETTSSASPETA